MDLTFSANFLSMLDLYISVTINSLKKYNEIIPVKYICVLLSLFQSNKMWQVQNQYRIWSVTGYISCPVINQGMWAFHL
jgi:hypothetical protein